MKGVALYFRLQMRLLQSKVLLGFGQVVLRSSSLAKATHGSNLWTPQEIYYLSL